MKIPYDMIKELASADSRWQLREIARKYGFELRLPADNERLEEITIQPEELDTIEQGGQVFVLRRKHP